MNFILPFTFGKFFPFPTQTSYELNIKRLKSHAQCNTIQLYTVLFDTSIPGHIRFN